MKFQKQNTRLHHGRNRICPGASARQFSGTLEKLEERQLLTLYTVNTLLDTATDTMDGMLSLREAMIASDLNLPWGDAAAGDADGDRIIFDPSLDGMTITLTEGQLISTDDLMVGSAATRVTVDGNNASRVFVVAGSEAWTFTNMILTGGNADSVGGGICFTGTGNVDINAMHFLTNNALGDGGGGFYNEQGLINIYNSMFTENTADSTVGRGGGILSDGGTVILTGVRMEQNAATLTGGGIDIGSGILNVYDSILVSNSAGFIGTGDPGNGGGIHVRKSNSPGTVTISNSNIRGNMATDQGGGIWNANDGQVFLRGGSVVNENTASGNNTTDGGGGIYNDGGYVQVLGSTISHNVADGTSGSGGGIFTWGGDLDIRQSNIFSNTANRAGGGIEVLNAIVTLQDSVLGGGSSADGNVAGPSGTAAPGNGGGLNISGAAGSVVDIDNTIVRNNRAASEGGGLWNIVGSQLIIENGSSVSYNFAAGNAAHDGGGGVFNNGGTLNVLSSTFDRNRATGASGRGGGLFSSGGSVEITNSGFINNVANRAGGGIVVLAGTTTITDSAVSSNVAGPAGSANPGNGGGVHVTDTATVLIQNSQIISNTAASKGGAFWNGTGSTLTIQGCSVTSNIAQGAANLNGGGGLFNKGGTVQVLASMFAENQATGLSGSGGAILSLGGMLDIQNADLLSNTASRAGGAIDINAGTASLLNSSLKFNVAGTTGKSNPGNGGGLNISGSGVSVVIDGGTISENVAALFGGGLYNAPGSTLTLLGGEMVVAKNQAIFGGGVFAAGGMTAATDAFFSDNKAVAGAGIYVDEGASMDLNTPFITGNSASGQGGGIYNAGALTITDLGEITGNTASNGGGIFTAVTGTTDEGTVSNTGNTPNNRN